MKQIETHRMVVRGFAMDDLCELHEIFGDGETMKKLGMTLEGIQKSQTRDLDGNWVDLYFYGLLQDEYHAKNCN